MTTSWQGLGVGHLAHVSFAFSVSFVIPAQAGMTRGVRMGIGYSQHLFGKT